MGRELVWPFFCFLPFIFPVIMSALQYLMTAHLFRQFQVASLLGEGMWWQQEDCVFSLSFLCLIVVRRQKTSQSYASNIELCTSVKSTVIGC